MKGTMTAQSKHFCYLFGVIIRKGTLNSTIVVLSQIKLWMSRMIAKGRKRKHELLLERQDHGPTNAFTSIADPIFESMRRSIALLTASAQHHLGAPPAPIGAIVSVDLTEQDGRDLAAEQSEPIIESLHSSSFHGAYFPPGQDDEPYDKNNVCVARGSSTSSHRHSLAWPALS